MKKTSLSLLFFLLMMLSACAALPADLFSFNEQPAAPVTIPETATPTVTRQPIPTRTPTPTLTPQPTRRSLFPVGLGTPLPDMGFPQIGAGNTSLLKTAFTLSGIRRRAVLVSPDQQSVVVATSNGIYLFDRENNLKNHWPELRLFDIPCQSCISVNEDVSMIAMLARSGPVWEVRVLDIVDGQVSVYQTFVLDVPFRYTANPAQVALSPSGQYLAYGPGNGRVTVIDLFTATQVFQTNTPVSAVRFSPDGSLLAAMRGRELLLWQVNNWQKGFQNLLLPREDTPIAFSSDGKYLALALSSRIRIHGTERLRIEGEINVRPTYVNDREWQIVFDDATRLRGYGLQWDASANTGTVTLAEWDVSARETIRIEESTTTSPDAFASFWGINFEQEAELPLGLEPGEYRSMRFISIDTMLLNGLHSVCRFRFATGETSCQTEPGESLYASDGLVFREQRDTYNTRILAPDGLPIFQFDPKPIAWANRSLEFVLLDNNSATTDLYVIDQAMPVQSVPGAFRSAAENPNYLVFLTRERTELMYMTMVEKSTLRATFQKRETRLYDPIGMALDGTIYFLREDRDNKQAILKAIAPGTDTVSDLMRINLSADPVSITVSSQKVLALGLQDGNVVVISLDSLTQGEFQPVQGPVTALAFSPDGRYLAVASREDLKVFSVIER